MRRVFVELISMWGYGASMRERRKAYMRLIRGIISLRGMGFATENGEIEYPFTGISSTDNGYTKGYI